MAIPMIRIRPRKLSHVSLIAVLSVSTLENTPNPTTRGENPKKIRRLHGVKRETALIVELAEPPVCGVLQWIRRVMVAGFVRVRADPAARRAR